MNKWIIFVGLKIAELMGIPLAWYILCHIGQWMYKNGYSFLNWGVFWLHGITVIWYLILCGLVFALLFALISLNIKWAEKLHSKWRRKI